MYGGDSYGGVAFGAISEDLGVPIIPEVTQATTTLVFVVEIDALISPTEE